MKHSRIHYWNKPVLRNECKVAQGNNGLPLTGFEPMWLAIFRLLVRHVTHLTMPPQIQSCFRLFILIPFQHDFSYENGKFSRHLSWEEPVLDFYPLCQESIFRVLNPHQRDYWRRSHLLLPLNHGGRPNRPNKLLQKHDFHT